MEKNFEYNESIKKYKKSNAKLKKEIKDYEMRNDEILNSRSWKITKPFRQISNSIRRFKKD